MSRVQLLCRSLPKLATSPEHQLETFTLFPELPHELRNKIWRYVASVSRNVTVTMGRQYRNQIGQLPAPSVLQATQESRTEAMRYYTLCIDYAAPPPTFVRYLGGKVHPPVWINFAVDVFLLGPEASYHNREVKTVFNFDDNVLSQIQNVEMKCKDGIYGLKKHMDNFRTILVQKSLVSLTVVIDDRLAGISQGNDDWFWRELSLLKREEQLRQRYAKQLDWTGCIVQPHIMWNRGLWFDGQYF